MQSIFFYVCLKTPSPVVSGFSSFSLSLGIPGQSLIIRFSAFIYFFSFTWLTHPDIFLSVHIMSHPAFFTTAKKISSFTYSRIQSSHYDTFLSSFFKNKRTFLSELLKSFQDMTGKCCSSNSRKCKLCAQDGFSMTFLCFSRNQYAQNESTELHQPAMF